MSVRKMLGLLRSYRSTIGSRLERGMAHDYADYREMVGFMRGIDKAVEVVFDNAGEDEDELEEEENGS